MKSVFKVLMGLVLALVVSVGSAQVTIIGGASEPTDPGPQDAAVDAGKDYIEFGVNVPCVNILDAVSSVNPLPDPLFSFTAPQDAGEAFADSTIDAAVGTADNRLPFHIDYTSNCPVASGTTQREITVEAEVSNAIDLRGLKVLIEEDAGADAPDLNGSPDTTSTATLPFSIGTFAPAEINNDEAGDQFSIISGIENVAVGEHAMKLYITDDNGLPISNLDEEQTVTLTFTLRDM